MFRKKGSFIGSFKMFKENYRRNNNGKEYDDSIRTTKIDREEIIRMEEFERAEKKRERTWHGQISTDFQYEGCFSEDYTVEF